MNNLPIILPNRISRHNASNTRSRINIAMSSDDRSGIAHRIAPNLNIVAYHCTELLDAGLDLLTAITDNNILLVRLDVRSDRTRTHMAEITKNAIANVSPNNE